MKFKSEDTSAFQFMSKHIVVKTPYISWVMGITNVSNNKSDLQRSTSLNVIGNRAIR